MGAPVTITRAKKGNKQIMVKLLKQDEEMTRALVALESELTVYSLRRVNFFVRTQ